jgi:PBP1b-binding outer membrane lipoprotein LpoB
MANHERKEQMKKLLLTGLLAISMLLSGCSFLGEVNNSIDYVSQATEHINTLNNFAEEAPQMLKEAAADPALKQELEDRLITLKQGVEEFIALNDIPTIAEDIHQELVNQNEALLAEINKVLENGNLALDKLESSEVFTTINEVTSLINRIESLGQ